MMVFAHAVLLSIGLIGLVVAAAVDVRLRLIPNPVVLGIAGAGFGLRVLDGVGGAFESLAIALVVFIPLGLLAGRKLLGGGDAKLIAAATLLVAPKLIPQMFLGIALAGGALALIYIATEFRAAYVRTLSPRNDTGASDGLVGRTGSMSSPISLPYGVAIGLGVAVVLLSGGLGCSSGTFC